MSFPSEPRDASAWPRQGVGGGWGVPNRASQKFDKCFLISRWPLDRGTAVSPPESRFLKKRPARVHDTLVLCAESESVLVTIVNNYLVINIRTVRFPVCTPGVCELGRPVSLRSSRAERTFNSGAERGLRMWQEVQETGAPVPQGRGCPRVALPSCVPCAEVLCAHDILAR